MLTSEQRAWAEGYKAGQLRLPEEDNPYDADSDNGRSWLNGYREGITLPQKTVPKSVH